MKCPRCCARPMCSWHASAGPPPPMANKKGLAPCGASPFERLSGRLGSQISVQGAQGACGHHGEQKACHHQRRRAWRKQACGERSHRGVRRRRHGGQSRHGPHRQNPACGRSLRCRDGERRSRRGRHGRHNRRCHPGSHPGERKHHGYRCHGQRNRRQSHHRNRRGHCHRVQGHQNGHAMGCRGCRTSGQGRHGHQSPHREVPVVRVAKAPCPESRRP